MTERTIEMEKTVTEQETITFCDYCGEPDGGEEMILRYGTPVSGFPELHLHEECAKEGLGNLGSRPERYSSNLVDLTWEIEKFVKRVVLGFWGVYSCPVRVILTPFLPNPEKVDVFLAWSLYLFIQILLIITLTIP